jgi:hypothetical protein
MVGTRFAFSQEHVERRHDLGQWTPAVLGLLMALCMATMANAQTVSDSILYSFPDRGGTTVLTTGGTASTGVVGYGRIQPGGGTTAPSAYELLAFRPFTTLVTETAIPATLPISSGRTYVETSGPQVTRTPNVRTGLAFTNTNATMVTISFVFTDQNGNNLAPSSFTLAPLSQTARFTDEFPFNMAGTFTGTLTFTATAPVAAVALRMTTNLRGEFTFTPLPIVSIDVVSTTPLVVSHFADGAGWRTQLVLVNPTDQTINGNFQFFGEGTATAQAAAVTITVNGFTASDFPYTIPARAALRFDTAGTGPTVQLGSIRITPAANSSAPSGFSILSLTTNLVTVTEATVPAQTAASSFRMFVDTATTVLPPTLVDNAIVITNPSPTAATVTFELTTSAGVLVGQGFVSTLTIPAFGHAARFVEELFPFSVVPFQGVLRITAATSQVIVTGFRTRTNERREFLITTIPVTNELIPAPTGELVFPQVVNLGGFTSQFVLFSGTISQSGLGTIRFFTQNGQPLTLTFFQ